MNLTLSIQAWSNLLADSIDSDTHVVWMMNLDYSKQIFVSPALKTCWGIEPDVLYDNKARVGDFLKEETDDSFTHFCNKRHSEMDSGHILYQIQSMSGEEKVIRDRFMTLYDEKNQAIAAAGVALDVTEKIDFIKNPNLYKQIQEQHQMVQTQFLDRLEKELKLGIEPNNNEALKLTKKERQCLYYLQRGLTARESAELLYVSPRTIEKHIDNVKKKFCITRRIDLLKIDLGHY